MTMSYRDAESGGSMIPEPTPEQMRAMAEPTCSGPFSDARDCPVHGPLMRVSAQDRLADALAKIDQLEATIARLQDELADIRKLAKIESLEDVLAHKPESEMSFRLRAFAAIATLRIELLAAKSEPGLVQKVCEAAASNLVRAQDAEATIARVRQWAEGNASIGTYGQLEWYGGYRRAAEHILDLITPPAEARETKDGASE